MSFSEFIKGALQTDKIEFSARSEPDGDSGDGWYVRRANAKIDGLEVIICYDNFSNKCDFDFDEISFRYENTDSRENLTWISEEDGSKNDAIISKVSRMLGMPIIDDDMIELSSIMKKNSLAKNINQIYGV